MTAQKPPPIGWGIPRNPGLTLSEPPDPESIAKMQRIRREADAHATNVPGAASKQLRNGTVGEPRERKDGTRVVALNITLTEDMDEWLVHHHARNRRIFRKRCEIAQRALEMYRTWYETGAYPSR